MPKDKKGEPPFSVDDNLLHTSTEGKILEDQENALLNLFSKNNFTGKSSK